MNFYLDTEFNGFGGELLSLALVPDRVDDDEMYIVVGGAHLRRGLNPWVKEYVVPYLFEEQPAHLQRSLIPQILAGYLASFPGVPTIIADWPDDIRYFCQAIITGPGTIAPIPALRFEIQRVDAYPTDLPGAIQHHALWDARALRHRVHGLRDAEHASMREVLAHG